MTPMMEQYFEIKNQYKDFLLFYRLGDFYEMFFDDAITASRELELTLTGRDCGEAERAPMCGVPFHSADSYISKLIEKGYKVAICEQLEDPSQTKGLVKRDVIRMITPGTVREAEMLNEAKNNYLCSICISEKGSGICFCDISTAQIFATYFTGADCTSELLNELATYTPSEVLINLPSSAEQELAGFIKTRLCAMLDDGKAESFEFSSALKRVEIQFGECIRSSDKERRELISALGALLNYIATTQKTDISYIRDLNIYESGQYMQLDVATRRNLELVETMRSKDKRGSLLWVLDKTKTAPGKRMLRQWVERPLLNVAMISKRQNAVSELFDNYILREDLTDLLSGILDMDRLITKVIYGSANARDLRSICATLSIIPAIKQLLSSCEGAELCSLCENLDPIADIRDAIDQAITDENPPFSVREGGMIRDGFDPDVDRLREIVKDGKGWIKKIADREKEETGIKTLKIGYNRVFGYYIEVSKSFVDMVPERYVRKQTLTNGERYITDELKELEATVLGAADRLAALEYEIFCKIRTLTAEAETRIRAVMSHLATLDVYCSLASVAAQNNYVCPSLNDKNMFDIRDGRHPVVEKFVKDAYFVPNDTHLDMKNNRVMIITGPNMAGKSTYMRQVALMIVMTQIGSFVPAASADMCLVDRVFTRVGASDDLASGQSTFMLEMTEVASILRNATKNSFIIFDEVGRGTSTFDGMSIARAILEYTQSRKVGAKTMFATHYHELTSIADEFEGIVNYNIAARKRGDGIVFLRKIVPGSTDDSYGIEVAKLAGVPNEVIKRAREVLAQVEAASRITADTPTKDDDDLITLDDCINEQIIDDIRAADVNNMSPFEALNMLYDLQKRLK